MLQSIEEKALIVELKASDFEEIEENWDDLPNTIATIIEIVTSNSEEKIVMESIIGSSAANLLARFCHGDKAIAALTKKITAKEQEMNSDAILAEIVHLPESRTGNILKRPNLRAYEIPYLCESTVDIENQIPVEDLMLAMQPNGKLFLRSKRLNKEIIPRLTNAHNYTNNALPIYQFLADMQFQHIRPALSFHWGSLAELTPFLPRVEYQGVIFSKARWRIRKEEIEPLFEWYDSEKLIEHMQLWKQTLRLPQYVQLIERDNTLLINLYNSTCIQMFLSTVKVMPNFILEEFLFEVDNGIVKNSEGYYTNQFVISFYNQKK